ncbi:asparagine--tRNA ligase [Permianibacter aggregans]|uniref:Asparagine--tRNA ligase n=1 Tax=Permianibacter aggregans TaxID=1510150 RepID=A0A4R6UZY0_9GAMM|nr:asparagine--tRNA ligase [Permianibacter aggregans]QGX41425.1 asparagine--tRNA ligase [Permianibacter aggregans]TDQ51215.1 asparaginyl-tRNA synthetase [Permianibacter aggregans]
MTRLAIADVLKGKAAIGSTVRIQGWVRTAQVKPTFAFINVHDGSGFHPIQVVAEDKLNNFQNEITKLTTGCSVDITGEVVPSPGKGQSVEIKAIEVKVLGWVENPETYPISPKPHSLEFLREQGHLRARTNVIGAVTRVRNCIAQAIHRFHHEQGFVWIASPIITASDCEGAGEMFRVSTLDMVNCPRGADGKPDYSQDFFGREAFLTVSGQLNAETYAMAMSKVYTFGPTFRAENSNTSRHLAEFWMVEPEIAFADLAGNADHAEAMLKYVFKAVLEERLDDMEFFAQRIEPTAISRLQTIIDSNFERMDYTEAVKILQASGQSFQFPVEWGMDLQSEHERYIAEKHVGRPVVMMNYPKDIKAFYMRLNDDGKTVAAMDVLAPGIGEIIGGSQREERLELFDRRLKEMQLPVENYWWYRDLRRYGTVPHSGFGLGLERCVAYVTGMQNVRDVIPFPRTPKSAEF